jgi:hypothetical protein
MSLSSAKHSRIPSYWQCYAAQVGAIGRRGQRRLQRASILIVGTGGLGTSISLTLASAGVGTLVLVDPQRFSTDNFNRNPCARVTDIDRLKVDVLASVLEGRPHLTTVPVRGRAERLDKIPEARRVDLVITASNTVASRLAVAHFAWRSRLPQISAALTDSRHGAGGFIVSWSSGRRQLACPACFLHAHARPLRGESLLAPTVAVVGALAASWALQALVHPRDSRVLDVRNCVSVDLEHDRLETLRVQRRPDCVVCAGVSRPRQVLKSL